MSPSPQSSEALSHDISDFSRERRRAAVLAGTVRRSVARDVREDRISPPLLPAVALELNKITRDPQFQMADVIEVIERDQFIAAKLLQAANSGFYGRGVEMVNGAYAFLDLVPKGRDEQDLSYPMEWLRRHDQY